LVLGLGNALLGDDGVGLRAARRVAELAGARADHVEACVATIDLLSVIAGYDRVIVIDAFISTDHPPGTALCGTPDDLPRGFGYRSLHSLPFAAMLDLGARLELPLPRELRIHGLSVDDPMTFGHAFTPAVEAAWERWAERIHHAEFGTRPDANGSVRRCLASSRRPSCVN